MTNYIELIIGLLLFSSTVIGLLALIVKIYQFMYRLLRLDLIPSLFNSQIHYRNENYPFYCRCEKINNEKEALAFIKNNSTDYYIIHTYPNFLRFNINFYHQTLKSLVQFETEKRVREVYVTHFERSKNIEERLEALFFLEKTKEI